MCIVKYAILNLIKKRFIGGLGFVVHYMKCFLNYEVLMTKNRKAIKRKLLKKKAQRRISKMMIKKLKEAPLLMCKCGKNYALPPHTCPYAEEINDDYISECTCCDECANECAMDI
jgi:hypothetical protein